MLPDTLIPDLGSVYTSVKLAVIVVAMWFVAMFSACGFTVGDNTIIGTPSFAKTVYDGKKQLQEEVRK